MEKLTITGDMTTELWKFVGAQLTDEQIDALEVDREEVRSHGIQSEPVSATIVLGGAAIAGVVKLIGRWLENRHLERELEIVAEGFKQDSETGQALTEIAKAHTKVAVAFAKQREPEPKTA
jgi:hypothetical protein